MLKKTLAVVAFVALLSTASVHAASEKGVSKTGWFIGGEWNADNIHYSTTEITFGGVEKDGVSPKTADGEINSYTLSVGKRYYFASSNAVLKRLGFGLKGWAGQKQYKTESTADHTFTNGAGGGIGDKRNNTPFTAQAQAISFGAETQVYYDLLNFNTGAVNHIMGITLGLGYEFSLFDKVNFTSLDKYEKEFVWEKDAYQDSALVYDLAFHYVVAARNRIEVGYKIMNYSKTVITNSPDRNGWTKDTITYKLGFNNTSTLYAAYTFTF